MSTWVFALAFTSLSLGASDQPRFDACALLTNAEVEAVQGGPVTATKSYHPADRTFAVAQCFYTVADTTKSVSLTVTRRQSGAKSTIDPKLHWQKLFHAPPAAKKKKNAAGPEPVADLGDQAFWVGDALVGALYVLHGELYFRLSLGGPAEQKDQIEKTKKLAHSVLRRLPSGKTSATGESCPAPLNSNTDQGPMSTQKAAPPRSLAGVS